MKMTFSVMNTLFLLLFSGFVFSQATRTWVSGVGDDVNPCSRTAPCKTLAGAITKTATGGEINILDPGGFGSVTITKSITIDGGGVIGSILSSSVTGIIINAPDGLVSIRNFSINGAGTTLGTNGIRVVAVKKLYVENCVLANFSESGIDIRPASSAIINVSNVTIHNSNDGIGSSGSSIIIDKCHIQDVKNAGITIGSGNSVVSNSVLSGCNIAVVAKAGAEIHLEGSVITNNGTALQGPGKITSSGNNSVTGNKAQGVNATVVKMQ